MSDSLTVFVDKCTAPHPQPPRGQDSPGQGAPKATWVWTTNARKDSDGENRQTCKTSNTFRRQKLGFCSLHHIESSKLQHPSMQLLIRPCET